ncbi:unnamed protein product [Strongylus vulgaris]|uniref:protein xylosyltransferase n=1 Tax=Strongylus vulgaris TaxID=40348 RepID=A0A3P7J500_STRVU|nr:unnamed protein product [Strongylus vulgaris]
MLVTARSSPTMPNRFWRPNHAISDAACKLKNGLFHDQFPESQCVNHEHLLINFRVGCFEDSKKDRALTGFAYDFKSDNSMEKCRSHCYRAGFIYYGLEFGRECFCGDTLSKPTLDDSKCTEYRCSGNSSQFCGGFNAVEVFRTGLKEPHLMPKAKYMETNEVDEKSRRPRILFLLQLNGRNERQVKRLLKVLYSPYHYYYIHVDQRQLYMLTGMRISFAYCRTCGTFPVKQLLSRDQDKSPNFMTNLHSYVKQKFYHLKIILADAIRRSISMPTLSDWDYLINLSESDFPVLTLNELETQLRLNPGKSYMSSHGYNTARFIQKQGFDFVFIECENRMWRIGKRDEFPRNLRIDGGSDWIILHRDFAEYSISDDELPKKMRTLFGSIILPVESFFHTKQGFDFVFIECENRMWRIGKRDEFPRNLRIDGGSDWIILHRDFAEYSISDDELPKKMRTLFGSIILPVESFFHTLAYNSRFCHSILGSNLRLTNWNRKQGCRCESLKKVVDWCGCSPLVFKMEHTHKFAIKNAQAKPFYIARKFESLIDIDAIAMAEEQALRDR